MNIYCSLSLFAMRQTVYVYDGEKEIANCACNLSDIDETISKLCSEYKINKIVFRGNEGYLQDIMLRILDVAKIKYGIYDLRFEVLK